MSNSLTDIFFDLDDTLWDFQRNSDLTFADLLSKYNLNVPLNRFLAIYKPINAKYWALYRLNKISKSALRYRRLAETFQALQLNLDAEAIKQAAQFYNIHLSDYNHLVPGVRETLDYLQERYNLHILTNGFIEVQDKKLKKAGIEHYFKTVTASDETGAKKPHPAIFKEALRKARAQKESSLMVGDNLETDVWGAANFGLRTIYFNPNEETTHNGQEIKAITELIPILR